MSDLGYVRRALSVLAFGYPPDRKTQHEIFAAAFADTQGRAVLDGKVTLHCTSEYPAPYEDVNPMGHGYPAQGVWVAGWPVRPQPRNQRRHRGASRAAL